MQSSMISPDRLSGREVSNYSPNSHAGHTTPSIVLDLNDLGKHGHSAIFLILDARNLAAECQPLAYMDRLKILEALLAVKQAADIDPVIAPEGVGVTRTHHIICPFANRLEKRPQLTFFHEKGRIRPLKTDE
jgi:hypothetical protein